MRFTALVTFLMGVMIGCLAGFFYADLGGPDRSAVPLMFGLMGLAAALTVAGAVMWLVGGRRAAHTTAG